MADVDLVEPTGHGIILHLRLGAASFKVLTHDRQWLAPGESVGLILPSEALHLFDDAGLRV